MEKLTKLDEDYQIIEITAKDIIEAFLKTFMPFWKEDILNFENINDQIKIENIKKLEIWSFIGLKEEINYNFTFNDNTTKSYYVPIAEFMIWLEKHDLVE